MQYFIAVVFVLLGLVNLNLVRQGLKTGRVQSRIMHIERAEAPTGFWSAIVLQVLISTVCFAAAVYRVGYE